MYTRKKVEIHHILIEKYIFLSISHIYYMVNKRKRGIEMIKKGRRYEDIQVGEDSEEEGPKGVENRYLNYDPTPLLS